MLDYFPTSFWVLIPIRRRSIHYKHSQHNITLDSPYSIICPLSSSILYSASTKPMTMKSPSIQSRNRSTLSNRGSLSAPRTQPNSLSVTNRDFPWTQSPTPDCRTTAENNPTFSRLAKSSDSRRNKAQSTSKPDTRSCTRR